MMVHLQKHRPYAQVVGLGGGIVWQQDGRYFYGDGREAPDPEAATGNNPAIPVASVADQDQQDIPAPPPKATPALTVEAIAEPIEISKDDMRLKENKFLKFQMEEQYGQQWQGVAHAKKFLAGEVK